MQFSNGAISWLWKFVGLLSLAYEVVADVDPIVIKTNGSEFFVRGVAYQDKGKLASDSTTVIDPLQDGPTCSRDIPYLLGLNTNVIRLYALDPTRDHTACMGALANAGIYVITDLGGPSTAFLNGSAPQWDTTLYDYYTAVVDSMAQYKNTLGFFVGTEVMNEVSTDPAGLAFVKAAARDIKAYIKNNNYRAIPVGYAAADMMSVRRTAADYLNCDEDAVDFYGYNSYAWCGDSSFTQSGWDTLTQDFKNYSIPVFLAEYGCTTGSNRSFTEVGTIYGSKMTGVWSGGSVYQYYDDSSGYGLVDADGNSVSELADYKALSTQMASIAPSSTNSASYTASNSQANCPNSISTWKAAQTLPPTPYARLCTCMMNSLSCIAKSSVVENWTSDQGSDYFSSVCGTGDLCKGITANTTGTYGAYSVCNTTEQASWVANQYYLSKNNASSACDLSGTATTQTPKSPLDSDCEILLNQAGAAGAGTITSIPQATGTAASVSRTISGGSQATGSESPDSKNHGPKDTGLSVGAKAGIGIGIAFLVILALLCALYFLHRKKKTQKAAGLTSDGAQGRPNGYEKPELDGQVVLPNPPVEMSGSENLWELHGSGLPPQEMEGSMPGVVREEEQQKPPGTEHMARYG